MFQDKQVKSYYSIHSFNFEFIINLSISFSTKNLSPPKNKERKKERERRNWHQLKKAQTAPMMTFFIGKRYPYHLSTKLGGRTTPILYLNNLGVIIPIAKPIHQAPQAIESQADHQTNSTPQTLWKKPKDKIKAWWALIDIYWEKKNQVIRFQT